VLFRETGPAAVSKSENGRQLASAYPEAGDNTATLVSPVKLSAFCFASHPCESVPLAALRAWRSGSVVNPRFRIGSNVSPQISQIISSGLFSGAKEFNKISINSV
jgi:hypothetical protein